MALLFFLYTLMFSVQAPFPFPAQELTGAWELTKADGTKGLLIMDENFFSLTYYKIDQPEFLGTEGGRWSAANGKLNLQWEYHTLEPKKVGQQQSSTFKLSGDRLSLGDRTWKRVDDGTPGDLKGAWLITGRQQEGEMQTMTPGARKTMKILSGTRFQWIAYNSETGEFFGTGGGSYTTDGGKYTENIEFFSRDNSRVGSSLSFDYDLKEGKWHHSGHSSKGEPLYEIWSTRQSLGI